MCVNGGCISVYKLYQSEYCINYTYIYRPIHLFLFSVFLPPLVTRKKTVRNSSLNPSQKRRKTEHDQVPLNWLKVMQKKVII